MLRELAKWQAVEGKSANEKPSITEWYWDLRVAMIHEGLLSKHHSWEVCRSYVNHWAKAQPSAEEGYGDIEMKDPRDVD